MEPIKPPYSIFISFLCLAYFSPLGWPLRLKNYWQFCGTIDTFEPKNEIAVMVVSLSMMFMGDRME